MRLRICIEPSLDDGVAALPIIVLQTLKVFPKAGHSYAYGHQASLCNNHDLELRLPPLIFKQRQGGKQQVSEGHKLAEGRHLAMNNRLHNTWQLTQPGLVYTAAGTVPKRASRQGIVCFQNGQNARSCGKASMQTGASPMVRLKEAHSIYHPKPGVRSKNQTKCWLYMQLPRWPAV